MEEKQKLTDEEKNAAQKALLKEVAARLFQPEIHFSLNW